MSLVQASQRWATLLGIGALAFVIASIAHEAIGHGGMCTLMGGRITLLSSVYARCSIDSSLIDAAGPSMGIAVGLVLWAILRSRMIVSPNVRLLLGFTMAINLFWGAGYLLFSAVINGGDWGFLVRDLASSQQAIGRSMLGAVGVIAYLASTRMVATQLPPPTPLLAPYLAMGIVSCVAVLFYFGPVVPALREAVNEGFLAPVGLLLIARRRSAENDSNGSDLSVVGSNGWIVMSLLVCIVFFATMGRGFGSA